MLSICIPVFNYDIRNLITSLNDQINQNNIDAEIIILDDGSSDNFRNQNRMLSKLSAVKYFEQDNQGRSATRNNLALKAQGEQLVFIDSDCLVQDRFLVNYLSNIRFPVIIGGLAYGIKPNDKDLLLRWRYGIKRECKVTKNTDGIGFLSSNFMIDKKLFQSIGFDAKLKRYGHEDTLLGIKLKKEGVNIIHINNPVIHMGLDNTRDFLKKTEDAIENLFLLIEDPEVSAAMNNNRLTRLAKMNLPVWINILFSTFFKLSKPLIQYYLKHIYPSLLLFDTYKFFFIFNVKNKNQTYKSRQLISLY